MFTKKVFQAQNAFSKSRCMSLVMLYGGLPVLSLHSSDVVETLARPRQDWVQDHDRPYPDQDQDWGREPRKQSFCRFTETLGRQVLGESNCV